MMYNYMTRMYTLQAKKQNKQLKVHVHKLVNLYACVVQYSMLLQREVSSTHNYLDIVKDLTVHYSKQCFGDINFGGS